jgi:hypothetical protein
VKRVVIESPYAGNVAENVAYARLCVIDSLRRGESPYASHLFFPQVLDDMRPEERKLGIEAGFAWGKTAVVRAIYIDRGLSSGMKLGILEAVNFHRSLKLVQAIEFRSIEGRDVCRHIELAYRKEQFEHAFEQIGKVPCPRQDCAWCLR